MERTIKLPIGKMNITYIRCKFGYAEGVLRPKRVKKTQQTEAAFNPPVLCLKLRKAA
jgi:hypothetical protein